MSTDFNAKFIEPDASFEKGSLHRFGNINVLNLQGSFQQMGRQYGHLMAAELQSLYQRSIIDHFMKARGLSKESMQQASEELFEFYPQRFKDILIGMSETSGLGLEKQIMLNAIELFGVMSGCSAIFAWDGYTGNKPLIAGRNYDWFEAYADFARSLTVTALNPNSGIPAAFVTFAGVIYATTGINSRGLFLELNNGMPSGGGLMHQNRVHAVSNLLAFLLDYQNMKQLDAAMNTTRSNFSFIINAADKNSAWCYEWPPFDIRRRSGDDPGLLVSTNHFADPSWDLLLQEDTGFESVLRRKNLLKLGKESKGKIDLKTMKAILDAPMEKGGATWPDQGMIRTVYQVIAIPEKLELWIKLPGIQDWTRIGLKGLFAE